jgi:hypothetical protein
MKIAVGGWHRPFPRIGKGSKNISELAIDLKSPVTELPKMQVGRYVIK